MDTFINTFSAAFGVVLAIALLPFLIVFTMTVIPNLITALIVRFASNEWKARKWKRAVERGDANQIAFMRKWGLDRADAQ
jgi:hypothetical protein